MTSDPLLPNPRLHGTAPYAIAVLHGGPGAPGSASPMARQLAQTTGVLEPLQTADTVDGQVAELNEILQTHASGPVTLIGWSWGAMLGLLTAARHPERVTRLILVGCGPLEAAYARSIMPTRLERLTSEARHELADLQQRLGAAAGDERDALLARFGALCTSADTYDPLPLEDETLAVQMDLHLRVWGEAEAIRAAGGFLDALRRVPCPVTAIHGDYDPHPAAGVRAPLANIRPDATFHLLERCGHEPWKERHARDAFFQILRDACTRL